MGGPHRAREARVGARGRARAWSVTAAVLALALGAGLAEARTPEHWHWHWPHRHHHKPPPPPPRPSPPAPKPPPPPAPAPAPLPAGSQYMVGFKLDLQLASAGNAQGRLDLDEFDSGLASFLNTSASEVRVNGTNLHGEGLTAVSGAVRGYPSYKDAQAGLVRMSAPGAAAELEKSLEEAGLPMKAGTLLSVNFVDVEECTAPAPGPGRAPVPKKRGAALAGVLISAAALAAVGLVAFRKRLLPLRNQPQAWSEEEQPLLA